MLASIIMVLLMCAIFFGINAAIRKKARAPLNSDTNVKLVKGTTLLIWSIVNCLLFLITGLFGLVHSIKACRAADGDKLFFYSRAAKSWNIVGSIIGVFFFISSFNG